MLFVACGSQNCSIIMHVRIVQVHIVREKVTWPGARIRKQDEGMPNYENNHKKGSLFITFDVDFPRNGFTEEQKQRKFSVSDVH